MRGHLQMRLGHPDQSEADYDKAIAAKPDDGWSWLGRGLARKRRNQTEPALADSRTERCPGTERGNRLGAQGEILGARDAGTKRPATLIGGRRWVAILSRFPGTSMRFSACTSTTSPAIARPAQTMWERFGKTSDPFIAALVAHASSLAPDCGVDAERVIALAEQAARAKPRDGWSLFTLGAALRRAGRFDQAITKFDQAASESPRHLHPADRRDAATNKTSLPGPLGERSRSRS